MKLIFIFGFLLSISICIKCISDYGYRPSAKAWFKEHKIIANWTDARLQCNREGAVLASPTSDKILNETLRIIRAKINYKRQSYFIGVHSTFSPGHFVSLDGIPIDNMPVADMIQQLDPRNGECLSTDGYEITVTSCETLLPYICYKEENNMKMTLCGTFDEAYKFEEITGSCYKLHKDIRTWEEANSLCISEGGYLVILNNEKEASLVYDMYPHSLNITIPGSSTAWNPLYIGLRDWGSGVWMSVHGEPVNQLYNTWHTSEPRPGQLCGALPRKGTPLEGEYCYFRSFFVCEKDPQNIRYREVNETHD